MDLINSIIKGIGDTITGCVSFIKGIIDFLTSYINLLPSEFSTIILIALTFGVGVLIYRFVR